MLYLTSRRGKMLPSLAVGQPEGSLPRSCPVCWRLVNCSCHAGIASFQSFQCYFRK